MRQLAALLAMVLCFGLALSTQAQQAERPLNIIVIGAHPDDADIKAGGTAALWAAAGHRVKFVAVTNGDIGHHEMAGGPLAQRRAAEVAAAGEILGIAESIALDNHDGELLPTLEIRKDLIRLTREWEADIVISHRTNDYHPDHRYTGVLVQDGAFMVTVPFMAPDTPALERNPVYLYMWDHFQKPNPFEPQIIVPIDTVIEQKLDALAAMPSQFAEWMPWLAGTLDQVPEDPAEARAWVKDTWRPRMARSAGLYREELRALYGEEAEDIAYVEAFEVTEYGRQPSHEELQAMFPFARIAPRP